MFVGDDVAIGDDDDDELMGLDEILGLDDDDEDEDDELSGSDIAEILGARRRRRRRRKPARSKKTSIMKLARQVALARATGGAVLKRTGLNNFREQVLPFQNTPLTILAAAPTQTLTATPQRNFRAKRVIIPSAQASGFLVTDISVAQEPQFAAPGAIFAQFFTEVGVGLSLKARTANLGAIVSMTVTNISGLDVPNFAPGVLGDVIM